MKNYHIKKVTQDGVTYFYPQKKVLFWWEDIFGLKNDGYFDTLDEAKYRLKDILSADMKTYVEYLSVDCGDVK